MLIITIILTTVLAVVAVTVTCASHKRILFYHRFTSSLNLVKHHYEYMSFFDEQLPTDSARRLLHKARTMHLLLILPQITPLFWDGDPAPGSYLRMIRNFDKLLDLFIKRDIMILIQFFGGVHSNNVWNVLRSVFSLYRDVYFRFCEGHKRVGQ